MYILGPDASLITLSCGSITRVFAHYSCLIACTCRNTPTQEELSSNLPCNVNIENILIVEQSLMYNNVKINIIIINRCPTHYNHVVAIIIHSVKVM